MKDYYKILGVKPNASPEDIHARWIELMRKFHPDTRRWEKMEEDRVVKWLLKPLENEEEPSLGGYLLSCAIQGAVISSLWLYGWFDLLHFGQTHFF